MKITDHFIRQEFDCRDGTEYPSKWIQERLVPLCNALEIIRHASGGTIHIISGYRTEKHNKRVGGASSSQHLTGRAVDMMSKEMSALKLGALIETLIAEKMIPDGGLGVYRNWIHYDQRGSRARWRG